MENSVENNKGSNRRVWFFIIAMICLMATAFLARANKEYTYKSTAAEHLTLVVDSVDFRKDITRIYGRFIGRPHTSQRVDSMTMNIGGRKMSATDIDGVDFNRWFQWEDNGVIDVEIDFPPMTLFESATLNIFTPRGNDRCTVFRKSDK